MISINEATPGRQIAYVPLHVHLDCKLDGPIDWRHPDIEYGFVAGNVRNFDGEPFVHCRYYNKPPHEHELKTLANGEATDLRDLWLKEHHTQAKIMADWRACSGGQMPGDFGL